MIRKSIKDYDFKNNIFESSLVFDVQNKSYNLLHL